MSDCLHCDKPIRMRFTFNPFGTWEQIDWLPGVTDETHIATPKEDS